MRRPLLWLCVMCVAVLVAAASAWAAVVGGTVDSVAPANRKIVVAGRSGMKKTYSVPETAEVLVDGRKATLDKIEAGQSVSITTAPNGSVLKVSARAGSSAPVAKTKPSTPETPADEPDPAPKSTRKSSRTPRTNVASGGNDPWPQFRGPNRDNISSETGLLTEWPQGGPRPAWQQKGLGDGYSSVAIAGGKVFTMGTQGDREMVFAMDLETGKAEWATPTGGNAFRDGQGNGPRGTPTIDGNELYALGAGGDLVCMTAANGTVKWSKNILREFGGNNITWGISESVLIDGENLICTPGGRQGTVVALNKNTGNPVWRSTVPGNPAAGYASPIAIDVDGVRQYAIFTSRGLVGVRARDGEPLWGDDSASNGTANCSTAVFDDDHVFYASGYGTGGSLVKLSTAGSTTKADRVYHTDDMKNHHGGMVELDGFLYGSNDPGILTCLDFKTGKVQWQNRSVGKGSVTYADGHLYVRSEGGPVALVEAKPDGYVEKGRFDQPQRSGRPAWAHPVVADGKLFLRDLDVLLVYDVSGAR